MKWFYDLKIASKLILGFIIVAVIAGSIGIIGILNIRTIDNNDTILYENITVPISQLAKITEIFQRQRVIMRDIILLSEVEDKEKEVENIKGKDIEIEKLSAEFEKTISKDEEERALFSAFTKALSDYLPYREKVVELALEKNEEQAIIMLQSPETDNAAMATNDAIGKIESHLVEGGKVQADGNTSTANKATALMIVLVAAGVIISIALGLFISGAISKPIKKIADGADKLALGDVNVKVDYDYKDEIGSLIKSFDKMIRGIREQSLLTEKLAGGDWTVEFNVRSEEDLLGKKISELVQGLNELMSSIASASEQVEVGSKQITDGSMALSQGATEQASSVEELTASLEEISSQTKLNAENANQANGLAENAKLNAVEGNNQMKEMLKAMEEINVSSSNIYKIIKVIDDIAFQTNILALNAAVEAARAGQYGKGFAVVAEEVRTLAGRSANAAKETTDLIESSIKKVEGGTKIAKDTAEALNRIVGGIEKVANLVGDIAVASNEQAAGISQVNQGIMQVSQVIQANSATAQESAASSEELASQATILKEMVSQVKLKKSTKSHSKFDDLSPELLKMLEEMSGKKKLVSNNKKGFQEANNRNTKIVLSDSEFGKY